MMREILFKAKRTDNKEWVEGYYTNSFNSPSMDVKTEDGWVTDIEVDQETVSQYTGLTDKNGIKIWEGDTMEFDAYGLHYSGYVSIVDGNACIWCDKCAPFLDDAVKTKGAIVTGNIHDKEETK